MFGVYRTLLAIAVVADHYLPANGAGTVAVFSFYCLSGFLMTLLMTGAYHGRPVAFLINRVLRLYPMYLATVLITLGVALLTPMIAGVSIPADPLTFMRQLVYWVRFDDPRIVPTAWAVTNEIVFYVLIALGISRTLDRTLAWLFISVFLTAYVVANDGAADIHNLYSPVIGASIPFALGATLTHLRNRIRLRNPYIAAATLIACVLATTLFMSRAGELMTPLDQQWRLILILYANLVPTVIAIAILYRLDNETWRTVDDRIGLFSYPIYLLQFVAGEMLLAGWLPFLLPLGRFVSTLLVTLTLAMLCLVVIDGPVQAVRTRIRKSGSACAGSWSVA
jgi:peptidoglycan/LPS O-acetylase OafA/YrhL